jgi:hypothetical protein
VVRVNGLLCARIVVVGFNHATNTTIYSINTDVTDEKAKSVIQISDHEEESSYHDISVLDVLILLGCINDFEPAIPTMRIFRYIHDALNAIFSTVLRIVTYPRLRV